LAAAAIAACGGQQTDTPSANTNTGSSISCTVDQDTRIAIATGNTTGVYYPVGNALATQISDSSGGKLKATAAETGASVQNIQQLNEDKYQVAFSLFDTATDAFQGKGTAFTGKPVKIQALGRLYDNATHVVVQKTGNINSMADLKGKKVSTGSPNSGTEVIANRLLTAAGLDPAKDVSAQRLDLAKTTAEFKAGTIDAFVWSGGLPTGGVSELVTTAADKVKFLDITPLLPKMQEINAGYKEGTIPAATYKQAADTKTIVVPNVLLVKDTMDANVACAITKTLVEKRDELAKVNAAAKGITLDTVRNTDPVPLHPGAKKALDDLGAK
jgi:TRAP transporter TAXI family solute receptor